MTELTVRFPVETPAADLHSTVTLPASLGADPTVSHTPVEPTPPASDAPPQIPGYCNDGELGRGGMGVVYKAVDLTSGETVAIKTILPRARVSAVALTKFVREMDVICRLDDPGIVRRRCRICFGPPSRPTRPR